MEPKERRALLLVLVIVVIVITVPFIYGFTVAPPEKSFTGLVGQNAQDQAFYIGWGAKQAEQGHFLFEDKYNGDTSRRLVFNPLWLLMGWASRLTRIPVIGIYHLQRILFSVLLLLIIYRFLTEFTSAWRSRIFGLLLIAFSSGFGLFQISAQDWFTDKGIFVIPAPEWTPDLWVIESNIFLTMLWELVLPCGTLLFLLSLFWGFQTLYQNSRSAVATGLITLLLGCVYPYAVVSIYCILGTYTLFLILFKNRPWSLAKQYLCIVLIALPIVAYDGYLVLTDPKLTTGQALYPSSSLYKYFLSFGLISFLAVWGSVKAFRSSDEKYNFLFVWILVTFFQIYLPIKLVPFQMQLILGIQIPLVILALFPLQGLVEPSETPSKSGSWFNLSRVALLALLLACLPTTLFHYRNVFAGINRESSPEFMETKTRKAIEWLAENTRDNTLVLADPPIAPYIPVFASNRMYSGDYAAPTANFEEKKAKVNWFFSSEDVKTDAEILGFLKENRIDYIFFDSRFKLGGGVRFKKRIMTIPGIKLSFENKPVSIFTVSTE